MFCITDYCTSTMSLYSDPTIGPMTSELLLTI